MAINYKVSKSTWIDLFKDFKDREKNVNLLHLNKVTPEDSVTAVCLPLTL